MSRKPGDSWAEWLQAERTGADDRADSALREAFAALPRRSPTPGFHERLVRTAIVPRRPLARRSEAWVAAGLVLTALALTAAPIMVIAAFFLVTPGRVVSGVARACVWLGEWLNAGASIWGLLERTGSALGYAVVTPAGSSMITVALLVASMALLVLNRYLPAERSES